MQEAERRRMEEFHQSYFPIVWFVIAKEDKALEEYSLLFQILLLTTTAFPSL